MKVRETLLTCRHEAFTEVQTGMKTAVNIPTNRYIYGLAAAHKKCDSAKEQLSSSNTNGKGGNKCTHARARTHTLNVKVSTAEFIRVKGHKMLLRAGPLLSLR